MHAERHRAHQKAAGWGYRMPAKSVAQRKAMAIAEHHPSELHKENRGMLKMSKSQLHDFAATKETHMPTHVTHVHEHLSTPHTPPHKGVDKHGEAHTGHVAGNMPA